MLCMVIDVVLVVHFHLNQNTCTFLIMQIGNVCPTFSAKLCHLNEMRMHHYAQYHNTTIPLYQNTTSHKPIKCCTLHIYMYPRHQVVLLHHQLTRSRHTCTRHLPAPPSSWCSHGAAWCSHGAAWCHQQAQMVH